MTTPKRVNAKPQTTLKDIAQATNLSVATVSRILAGKAKFAQETRERVESVSQAMGYRPNRLVAGIQTGHTGMIGAILPIHAWWGAHLMVGLQQELARSGYVPIVLDCPSRDVSEPEMIYSLLDRRVEGVILFPGDDGVSDEYFGEIHSRNIPLVTVIRRLERAKCHIIEVDDHESGRLAAEHLLSLGHRHLAQITGPWSISTGRNRAEGFWRAAMGSKGATVAQVVMPQFIPEDDLIRAFLDNHPSVTGIYCASEAIALGLYGLAKARGLRIPEDLSVISHGAYHAAEIVSPKLTAVEDNTLLIGQEAARAMLGLIRGEISGEAFVERRIPVHLVVRESTAAPRGAGK
jgi:LacI family transcriptional regulator